MRKKVIAGALALALVFAISGCEQKPSTTLELTGSVIDNTLVIPAPRLEEVRPDLDVGFETSSSAFATAPAGFSAPAATSWIRVDRPAVRVGDTVNTGEALAFLDDRLLVAAVAAAEHDLARARADADLLDWRLGDVADNRSEIASQTAELQDTIADLRTQRAEVAARLEAAKRAAAAPPSTPTTPSAGATGTPSPTSPTPAQLVAQLTAALDDIDEGLEQAEEGLAELEKAGEEIDAVRTTITGAKAVLAALVKARELGVEIAQAQVGRAAVLAPVTGTVISVAAPGDVLAAGAPLATIRPDQPSRIETFLTAEQVRRVAVGGQAFAMVDGFPNRALSGHITAVSDEHGYVPTTFASKIIHLNRGFKVTVELDGGTRLPAGTPADLAVSIR